MSLYLAVFAGVAVAIWNPTTKTESWLAVGLLALAAFGVGYQFGSDLALSAT